MFGSSLSSSGRGTVGLEPPKRYVNVVSSVTGNGSPLASTVIFFIFRKPIASLVMVHSTLPPGVIGLMMPSLNPAGRSSKSSSGSLSHDIDVKR